MKNAIPTAGLHTIEHLLAIGLLRDRLDGVIDCLHLAAGLVST